MLIEIETENLSDETIEALKKLVEYSKDKTAAENFTAKLVNGDVVTVYPDFRKDKSI